jgi:hypothetical protein
MSGFTGIVSMVGCSSRHAVAVVNSEDPNAAWTRQKAIDCQGDMNKLPAEDQLKLKGLYGFPGAPSMIANDYRLSKGGQ